LYYVPVLGTNNVAVVVMASFRAATVRNILDFPGQFSPNAEIVTLNRNYRSTQSILFAANGVIKQAKERFTKNLWTERSSSAKPCRKPGWRRATALAAGGMA
jgi:superfamily I DNA/RNA helicase